MIWLNYWVGLLTTFLPVDSSGSTLRPGIGQISANTTPKFGFLIIPKTCESSYITKKYQGKRLKTSNILQYLIKVTLIFDKVKYFFCNFFGSTQIPVFFIGPKAVASAKILQRRLSNVALHIRIDNSGRESITFYSQFL